MTWATRAVLVASTISEPNRRRWPSICPMMSNCGQAFGVCIRIGEWQIHSGIRCPAHHRPRRRQPILTVPWAFRADPQRWTSEICRPTARRQAATSNARSDHVHSSPFIVYRALDAQNVPAICSVSVGNITTCVSKKSLAGGRCSAQSIGIIVIERTALHPPPSTLSREHNCPVRHGDAFPACVAPRDLSHAKI